MPHDSAPVQPAVAMGAAHVGAAVRSDRRCATRLCIVCNAPIRYEAKRCCSRECARTLGRMHSNRRSPEWPEERVRRLRVLWNEGLSCAEIGRTLGTTTNSIVGKAHRLGLPGRPSPIKGGAPKGPRPPRRPTGTHYLAVGTQTLALLASLEAEKREAARKAPPKPQRRPEPPQAPPVPVSPHRTCQFIFNDDPRHPEFCGKPTQPGSPYCRECHARCYVRRPHRDALEWAA